MNPSSARLRELLSTPEIRVMPCCYDALSARLVEAAGFALSFMSGFAVSASRLGAPDTGLISYGEMLDQGRNICAEAGIPIIGDGDTGYGNPMNVRRTVRGYAAAGFAGIMIEDQVAPKRCGHTRGKVVVSRDDALRRIEAAVDARDAGADILIMARTDARATLGLDEAIDRARRFRELGADILFVEAPRDETELSRVGAELDGPKMANMVEGGDTPYLSAERLQSMGFKLVAHPLTLLSASIRAMQSVLADLANGGDPRHRLLDFAELRQVVGFDQYHALEQRYAGRGEDNGSGRPGDEFDPR